MVYLLNKIFSLNLNSSLNFKSNKKGVFFVEIVFIVLLLFATYTILVDSLENKKEEIEFSQEIDLNKLQLNEFCSQLISSPGSPQDWNTPSQVDILGLKKNDSNELSTQKIMQIDALSQAELQRLNIEQYQIIIRNLSNSANISRTNNSNFGIDDTNFQFTRCYGYRDSGEDTIIEVRTKWYNINNRKQH